MAHSAYNRIATSDSKELRDRLLASGAQPLVGLVERHRPTSKLVVGGNENNNNDCNNDGSDQDHQCKCETDGDIETTTTTTTAATNKTIVDFVSKTKRETFYLQSSRRSILKNNGKQPNEARHIEQETGIGNISNNYDKTITATTFNRSSNDDDDNDNDNCTLAKVSAPLTVTNSNNTGRISRAGNNSNNGLRHNTMSFSAHPSSTTQAAAAAATTTTTTNHLSNHERLKLTTVSAEIKNSKLHQQQQHRRQQRERGIFVEKEYPQVERTNKRLISNNNNNNNSIISNNNSNIIKRSQSRISWNLDEDDPTEAHKRLEIDDEEPTNATNNNNIRHKRLLTTASYIDDDDDQEDQDHQYQDDNHDHDNRNHNMYPIDMDKRIRSSPSPSRHLESSLRQNNGKTVWRQSPVFQSNQAKYRQSSIMHNNNDQSMNINNNNNNNNHHDNDDDVENNRHTNAESRRYKRNKYYPTSATPGNNKQLQANNYLPAATDIMLPRSQSSNSSSADYDHDQDPEPVYVCRCCGLACELAPSMRYLHKFKTIFFIFNFLVMIFGVANFGMGLWFRIDPKVYELHKYIQTNNYTSAGWIMLFAGFTVTITAIIGFRAASKSRPGYLIYYFVMVAIVTLLLMGSLVLVTVYGLGDSLERFATKEVFQQIQNKTRSDKSAQFLDFIQIKMKCCGASSFLDYGNLGMNPPVSCYAVNRNYVNAPGCGRAFRELFDIRAGMAAGFSAGSVFVQLVAITMAAIMFCIIYHSRIPTSGYSPSQDQAVR